MEKPVLVLGSGPAGLMAAFAVARMGLPLVIVSSGGKSRLGGAQFLHQSIPGLTEGDGQPLEYVLRGSPEGYQTKVYGATEVPFVSFERVRSGEVVPAWPLLKVYDLLWEMFGGPAEYNKAAVGPKWLTENINDFSMVLSTVPLTALCLARAGMIKETHAFTSQTIRIHPECLEEVPNNTILYDGTPDRTWYRSSRIFGVGGTEWSIDAKTPPGLSPIFQDRKPIHTDCDCWNDSPTPVVRLGRRGQWKKGVLTHDAYTGAIAALYGRFGR